MRKVILNVAASLDGFIEGPKVNLTGALRPLKRIWKTSWARSIRFSLGEKVLN